MDEKQALIVNRLRRFLIDRYAPEMIILYGSTARGDTDEFSDIDIMVIMDVEESEKVSAEIMEDTDYIVHDKHIMIRSVCDYYSRRDIPGTMVYSALSEGLTLFRRPGFDTGTRPLKNYEERKRDIIEKDYLEQIRGFLEKAEWSLDNKQLFRCRDFLRFAFVRFLKAVMVFCDVHPPRSTDLEMLFEKAVEMFPEVEKTESVIKILTDYLPAGNEPENVAECRYLLDMTRSAIDAVASLLC